MLFAAASATKAGVVSFPYLADAANQIAQIDYASGTELSGEDAGKIAKIACGALTELIEDKDFSAVVNEFTGTALKGHEADVKKLIGDLASFSREFRRTEVDFLKSAGYKPPAIGEAVWLMALQRNKVDLNAVSAQHIATKIKDFQSTVCNLKNEIVYQNDRAAVQRETIWIVWGFFGIVVIATDTGVAAFTAGGGAVVAGASTALGVAMVSAGAEALAQNKR
jgi:hypothetical protein